MLQRRMMHRTWWRVFELWAAVEELAERTYRQEEQ